MLNAKKLLKTLLVFLLVALCAMTAVPIVAAADDDSLYLGGFPAGFVLNTTTVEVIGICDVMTEDGMQSPARDSGIRTGDVIDKINGEEVNKTSDINKIISEDYKEYTVTVIRGNEELKLDINPVKELSTGGKRLGVLVKDSINGIGTVTYIDKGAKKFASLGHPVTDTRNSVVEINGGSMFGCVIYDVKKGVRGAPGELRGAFESGNMIGRAVKNCACGVYGDISSEIDYTKLIKVEKGSVESAKIGEAYIYSTLKGNIPKKYKISIAKVDKSNKDNRNYVIKVEDKELISASGGIVQGMSGSPIVQDGKIIGAVTHVFINDPTRGFGIAIDKMLSSY